MAGDYDHLFRLMIRELKRIADALETLAAKTRRD